MGSLTGGLFLYSADASTPKAGGICQSLNQVATYAGYTYKCTKSGKKLLWSKGIKVPVATKGTSMTQQQATPTEVIPAPASPIAIDRYSNIASLARTSILNTDPAGDTPIEIKYQFDSGVPMINQNVIKEGANNFLKHFSHIMKYNPNPFGIIGWSAKSLGEPLVKSYDPASTDFQNDMTTTFSRQTDLPGDKCAGMGGFSVGYERLIVIQASCQNLDDGAADVVTHELTHEVQASLNKGVNPRMVAPVWMVEGQAQVVGAALAVQNGVDNWLVGRGSWVLRIPKGFTLDDIKAMEGETSGSADPSIAYSEYTAGGALEEYLIAKFGFQKSLDIYAAARKVVPSGTPEGDQLTNYFKVAFKKVFGENLDDFYAEALSYINYLTTTSPTASLNYVGVDPIYILSEGCHAPSASATIQELQGAQWVDISNKMGWDLPPVSANCPANTFRPWTAVKIAPGTTLRWHVYAPGIWDWYSNTFKN